MTSGIVSNPGWYPGLSSTSSFEAFQKFFYANKVNNGVCTTAPCPQTTTPQPLPGTCAAAYSISANDAYSSGTCGSRISFLMSPSGGALTQAKAQQQTALQFLNCSACWPWPKYKDAGDGRLSSKRGIAMQNSKFGGPVQSVLAQQVVTWGYTWSSSPSGQPSFAIWQGNGMRYVPMIWGNQSLQTLRALPKASALLGFNEPSFTDQSNLSPGQAAGLWPQLQRAAAAAGIGTIVSPGVALGPDDPIAWLNSFFKACVGCQVDAIAFHSYTCRGLTLQRQIDMFRVFGKPLWLTEFACSDPNDLGRLPVAGQMDYMMEAIPMLEHDPDIQMYAWFSYFAKEWAYPIVPGDNGDCGLIYPNGTLSALGSLYSSFASTSYVAVPPTTTPTPCHTSLPGETCYTNIMWAMQTGLSSHPDWYPGMTSSASFTDWQSYMYKWQINNGVCSAPPCPALLHRATVLCPGGCSQGISIDLEGPRATQVALQAVMRSGVHHLKLNQVAWHDAVLAAIDEEAGLLSKASLQLSLPCTESLSSAARKLRLKNVGRILVKITCCDCDNAQNESDYFASPTVVAAHEVMPGNVEFIIPQDATTSPELLRNIALLRKEGRKFHVGGTPTNTSAQGLVATTGFDGIMLETGNLCVPNGDVQTLAEFCTEFQSSLKEDPQTGKDSLTYLRGSACSKGLGLFQVDGSLSCSRLLGWPDGARLYS